jgi:hypothetical protein
MIKSWRPGDGDYGEFDCPDVGLSTGYYGVMLASDKSLVAPNSGDYNVECSAPCSSGSYPAREAEVFTYSEGTFYGNLFHPLTIALASTLSSGGAPANNMLAGLQYACHSDMWVAGVSHLADRFCADPNENACFQNIPGMCYPGAVGLPPQCAPGAPCGGAGAGVPVAGGCDTSCRGTGYIACDGGAPSYGTCAAGTSKQWENGLTVYLNHPCDLSTSADGKSCEMRDEKIP